MQLKIIKKGQICEVKPVFSTAHFCFSKAGKTQCSDDFKVFWINSIKRAGFNHTYELCRISINPLMHGRFYRPIMHGGGGVVRPARQPIMKVISDDSSIYH